MKRMGLIACMLGLRIVSPVPAEEAEPVYELEDIAVTGTRTEKRLKDTPVVTEVITSEEIEHSSAATVTEILDDYGIMYTSNGMGDYIQLQGMGEGRVLYLIDGRRVAGRIAQRLNGETMPLANVERIEIVRGPQSALYGSDGIGGVINIITKKPGDTVSLRAAVRNSFLLAYNNPDTPENPDVFKDFDPVREQHFTAAVGFPIAATRNSVNLEASRGAFYLNEKKDVSVLPEYYRGKAGVDTSFPLGNSAEMSLGGSFMVMRSDEKTNAAGSRDRKDYIRADGYIEAEFSPLESGILTLRLYDNFYQRDRSLWSGIMKTWTTGAYYENENFAALEAIGTYDGISNFIFTSGIEGAYNSIDKYNLHKDGTFAAVDKEALYVQAEYFREDHYSFIAGLRGERNSQFGFGGAPKFSAMVHLPGGFRMLGGAGLGYRAPSFSDLYITMDDTVVAGHPRVLGNENLQPEYALGFNLGLEYSKENRYFAQINGYYTELWNEIIENYQGNISGSDTYQSDNVARSLRAGFDAEGRLTVFEGVFVSAGYSWLFSYDRTEAEEFHPQPAHTAKMKLGWDHKKTGINTYFQGRFFSPLDPADASYDPRFILDFYAAFSFAKRYTVHVSVDNITGLIDPLGPTAGQKFTAGFKYFL
ncbi:MAG: TonB-dependent receptor [Treponema sp.]|jgi:outer membrane receptor for ferrienterochelin and colicins|nr:TonB-dependent receptor [Treponema sp.]